MSYQVSKDIYQVSKDIYQVINENTKAAYKSNSVIDLTIEENETPKSISIRLDLCNDSQYKSKKHSEYPDFYKKNDTYQNCKVYENKQLYTHQDDSSINLNTLRSHNTIKEQIGKRCLTKKQAIYLQQLIPNDPRIRAFCSRHVIIS